MRFCVLICALLLAGCNTVEGFGQDMQRLGDNISGASRNAQGTSQPAGYQSP